MFSGGGPGSSQSETSQKTRQTDRSQTVSDYGVAYAPTRSGNLRLGKNATLIQYVTSTNSLSPSDVTPLPFTDPNAPAVNKRVQTNITDAPKDAKSNMTTLIMVGAFLVVIFMVGIFSHAKGKR